MKTNITALLIFFCSIFTFAQTENTLKSIPEFSFVKMQSEGIFSSKDIKKGKQISFRAEKDGGVVNLLVGKVSFSNEELDTNIKEAINTLQKMKPSATKGTYFKSVYVSTTMGGSFELDVTSVLSSAS